MIPVISSDHIIDDAINRPITPIICNAILPRSSDTRNVLPRSSDTRNVLPRSIQNQINEVSESESVEAKSDRMRKYVIRDIVQPDIVSELKDIIEWKYRWKRIGTGLIWTSYLFVTLSGVLSYLQVHFTDDKWLSLCAGVSSTIALSLIGYGSKATSESQKNTRDANTILASIGIEKIPELWNKDSV